MHLCGRQSYFLTQTTWKVLCSPPQQLGQRVASANCPALLNKALHSLAVLSKLFVCLFLLIFNQNFWQLKLNGSRPDFLMHGRYFCASTKEHSGIWEGVNSLKIVAVRDYTKVTRVGVYIFDCRTNTFCLLPHQTSKSITETELKHVSNSPQKNRQMYKNQKKS